MDIEPTDDHVQVAKQLADPEVKLFCHFVAYAMKPINKDSIQTHASCVGTLIIRSVVHKLLRVLLTNFIEPKVPQSTDDISYQDRSQQVKDDELGIGTSTHMLLCGELEDEVVGTRIETRFLGVCVSFIVRQVLQRC